MEIEAEIQQLARQLLGEAQKREPVTLSPAWLQERLLAWATSDPEFRVKLLRFVDVLPSLRNGRAVAEHIRQYFRDDTPPVIHFGAELATPAVFRPVVSQVVRQGVFAMAHRFIAGETPEQSVGRLRELAEHGVAYTVDLLGEATLSEQEADVYFERYAALIRTLAAQAPGPQTGAWQGVAPVNISVKLSALTSHFEPAAPQQVSEAVRSRLQPLLRLARRHGCFINVDMEQYQYRDLVQSVFADAVMEPDLRDYANIGIVVQAYLKSSEASIRFLRQLTEKRGTPITVRLVKGAYWDEERIVADEAGWDVPVYEDKAATDASYERCTDEMLDAW
ncbi:MAG TPA: proline dehydrogenase family protein, partial [Dehalococcoidia bacterium]|nr:proline dehydrogenase family protein [Dehalococcoidia bacterium]